ncbi:hypothetical protein FXF51_01490 [Nonomuraea sp. PA05]|uniref:hypothetical protein n=1 Tax=Nonomuraea sp. PA05 TaxID=2604466 RepID=UPI0011DBAC4B|nr:hypothetical protein [Nonomuraea sp. PA05]TYB71134.1 hypothetical protein FXF51_01490 [Nonomuraea sp. PA05]
MDDLGKLVATGDADADAYLHLAREIHGLSVAVHEAADLLDAGHTRGSVMWPPAVTDLNPLGYEYATDVVHHADEVMEEAWARATQHYQAASARNSRAAELADLHVGRLFDPAFTLES